MIERVGVGKRAAIVIGVNKTGTLTPLKAAISGAEEVSQWLASEGFRVKVLTDKAKALGARDIKKAVIKVIDDGGYDKLVVYFAGHGYLNGTSEIWLLSGAPDDPNEAIDQSLSAEFARSCGIPSVTFISDACRSLPQTLAGNRLVGVSIFPNRQVPVDVEIDRFFATRPGDAALEIPETEASKRYVGLFTEILKSCHLNPPPSLMAKIEFEGKPAMVVPCRRLKDALPQIVDNAAQQKSILLTQLPQLRLECGDDTFLARVQFTKGAPEPGSRISTTGLLRPRRLQHDAVTVADDQDALYYSSDVQDALSNTQFRRDVNRFMTAQTIREQDRNGFQVMGKSVLNVFDIASLPRRRRPDVTAAAFAPSRQDEMARSVLIEFEDGTGGVIAILRDYIATLFVSEIGIQNISYVPSPQSVRGEEYEGQRKRTEQLRAIAAAAAKNGILAVDRDDAKRFGDLVRMAKRWDPTLGLYAALAYAEVGLKSDVRSVARHMRSDLEIDFFDAVLLSDTIDQSARIFPLVPALSQTWMYITARGHRLPEALERAGRHRTASTWTTFTRDGMAILKEAIEGAEIQ